MPRHTVTIFSEGQEKAFEAPTAYLAYAEVGGRPTTKKVKRRPKAGLYGCGIYAREGSRGRNGC